MNVKAPLKGAREAGEQTEEAVKKSERLQRGLRVGRKLVLITWLSNIRSVDCVLKTDPADWLKRSDPSLKNKVQSRWFQSSAADEVWTSQKERKIEEWNKYWPDNRCLCAAILRDRLQWCMKKVRCGREECEVGSGHLWGYICMCVWMWTTGKVCSQIGTWVYTCNYIR